MALSLGAQGVWIGTRFVCATEASAPKKHQEAIINCGIHDTIRTTVISGRPLRALRNEYIVNWEEKKHSELNELLKRGIIPFKRDFEDENSTDEEKRYLIRNRPWLMGQVAGLIHDVKPAKVIVDEIVSDCIKVFDKNLTFISKL